MIQVFKSVRNVLADESCTAAQALDYRHPLLAGCGAEAAHACVRSSLLHRESDDLFKGDITRCCELIGRPEFISAVEAVTGEPH